MLNPPITSGDQENVGVPVSPFLPAITRRLHAEGWVFGDPVPLEPRLVYDVPDKPTAPESVKEKKVAKPPIFVQPESAVTEVISPGKGFDHPNVGGKLTICVLCHGDYLGLHRRCLNSIRAWMPAGRLDLRIAANQCSSESLSYLESLNPTKLYVDSTDRLKYAAMREMFYDEACPIETKWLVWFDDDSVAKTPGWATGLCDAISKLSPEERVGSFGQVMLHPIKPQPGERPQDWFNQAAWFRGRRWANPSRREAPNGSLIPFVVGGFWALNTQAMRECDIPDPRLIHWGGDICIGAQLWQNQWESRSFNPKQELVWVSASAPRGKSVAGNSPDKRKLLPWYKK